MPTYVYETIPKRAGAAVRRFEIQQRMADAALTKDPETGEPVQRVISGGLGFISAADEVPCASGGCMLPRKVAESTGGCAGGMCGHSHH